MWKLSPILFICVFSLHMIDPTEHKPLIEDDADRRNIESHLNLPWVKDKAIDAAECPRLQMWMDCGTACPINCENQGSDTTTCSTDCVPGCFCRKPFIFESGSSGTCVHPDRCP
ncbi:cysteine-rich venom protein 6-like [Engystomops pustulosus]|uniref:cysteine-rich venom protein 6-like n=1 Tax=Engystomops pustulosus TaxID=76066 RepID=UPI003AFB0501